MQTIDRAKSFYELLEGGYSVKDIADSQSLSRQTVYQILRRKYTSEQINSVIAGYKHRQELGILSQVDPEKTLSQNARDLGLAKSSLYELLGRHNALLETKTNNLTLVRKKEELESKSFNCWTILEVLGYRGSDGSISPNARSGVLVGNALCGKCGEVKQVSLANVVSGKSRMCQTCGFKHRKKKSKRLTISND
ncbi:helix-turn-helix domain-containing protein [Chroococcidiopsis sp.]|uniref:helix-turn-helix domain-containing protein n=1 Tax=Chroococcidiopsis sp. TaxID=3088168 RepID=UPI003F3643A0